MPGYRDLDYDVVVVGAGVTGLYQLHCLRKLGFRVRVLEAGSDVGGTWYWNRYPGCRFDSESYSYSYSFSQELLNEWDWTEHFSAQPQTERYLQFVADKFDLRKDIQFSSRVASTVFDEEHSCWEITVEGGAQFRCRFLIMSIGHLSAPTLPNIENIEKFSGEWFHTGLWPKEEVTFSGKDVAVVGTGASGVQMIQEISKTAKSLTVFQRNPNWCTPLHNKEISKSEMHEIRKSYPHTFQACGASDGGFIHTAEDRNALDVTEEEREKFWEEQYAKPGFSMWLGNFKDVYIDREANRLLSDFVARKIRDRVVDEKTAELLIPKDHGFGTKRVPQETFYYEVYNQSNVRLVSLSETPFECVTKKGIKTTDREYEFDTIVYATGFDAITGSFDRIDIRGVNGRRLRESWRSKIVTFLGGQGPDFPNFFMIPGPQVLFANHTRLAEFNVEWVTALIKHVDGKGLTRVEPRLDAAEDWSNHVEESGKELLINEVDSWMSGVNSNVEGKQSRVFVRYDGIWPAYRKRCRGIASSGYQELQFS